MVSKRKFMHEDLEPREAVQQKCIIYLKGWVRISVVLIKSQQMFLIKCVLSILFLMYMIMRFWDLFAQRRRDRINEKMRALQELIPNCNKVDLCFLVYAWYNFESCSLSSSCKNIWIHLVKGKAIHCFSFSMFPKKKSLCCVLIIKSKFQKTSVADSFQSMLCPREIFV